MRTGSVTRFSNSVLLGVARVFCGSSAANISNTGTAFVYTSPNTSVGASASTEFSFSQEYLEIPVLGTKKPRVQALTSDCALSVSFKEMTVRNFAITLGFDPTLTAYNKVLDGTIPLGTDSNPAVVRVEAVCVYPDKQNYMAVIFPRAIVKVNSSAGFSNSDNTTLSVKFESQYADVRHGGNTAWDNSPLGSIIFATFNA